MFIVHNPIIYCLISGAVKKNSLTSMCNKKDVEKEVAKWLAGARDREGNRTQRALREKEKKQRQNTAGSDE
jgi:hypothetical protein